MAINKLTVLQVNNLSIPGRYADGNGLYLDVSKNGTKSWLFRYQLNNQRKWMGLGPYDKKSNTLADARSAAVDKRSMVLRGIDPAQHEADERQRAVDARARQLKQSNQRNRLDLMTFRVCAAELIASKSSEWTNEKHIQQWTNTLDTYAYPVLGDLPVKDIQTEHIRRCLDPIWHVKTETASRVRQRIESVIDYAIANGWRKEANPARWKGLLDTFYPNPEKVKRKRHQENGTDEHFPALDYADMPAFMAELVTMPGVAAKALRFLILTVPRTTELRMAKWDEFDLEKKQWDIPAARMKMTKPHRVALSDAAVKLIQEMPHINQYVFPGWKYGQPLSDGGMAAVLKRMSRTDITVHGFRSTFRDYIGEETGHPFRLAEFALAHQLTDSAEKAYARGDMLKKRFAMMNDWAKYVDSKISKHKVVPINRKVQTG